MGQRGISRREFIVTSAGAALALGLLGGCSSNTGSASSDGGSNDERNETKEVVIATPRDAIPGSGDAFYCWEGTFVWEALTVNNGGIIEPWLAESWEHNSDCSEWTFHLRQDVFFTDGVRFDADSCMANIERWKLDTTSTYTALKISKSLPKLSAMEKTGDFDVKFTFSTPITTLEYALSDYGSPMFSPKCFDATTGAISDYAIGTGPYRIIGHVEDDYALLERNEDYYGDLGKVKTFRIRNIPDSQTRYSALVSGEVMGLCDNGAIAMDAAADLCDTNSSFAIDATPSHMTEYIFFDMANEYLADKRLRKAMSYAIDRDSINKALYGNLLVPAYAYLSNQSVFHLDIQDSYDPDKAKSLAKEVLGSNTADLNMIIRSSSADSYNLKAVAEYLKEAFAPLGINLSIEILDSSVYNDRQKSDNYNLGLTVSGVNNGDPASNFKQYFATTGDSNTTYNYHYSNPELDKLIDSAPTIADFDERAKVYDQIQEMLYEDMPVIPMFYEINVNIHNVAIKNYAGRTFGVGLPTIEWA